MFNSIDAASLAQQFAELEVSASRASYETRTDRIESQRVGLESLNNALKAFDGSISSLNSVTNDLIANKATLSDDSFFSVDAGITATSANYQIFVSQLAQKNAVASSTVQLDGVGESVSANSVLPAFGVITIALEDQSGNDLNDAVGSPITPLTIDLSSDLAAGSTFKDLIDFVNEHESNPGVGLSLVNSNGSVSMLATSRESGVDANVALSFSEDALDLTPAANDWIQDFFSGANETEVTQAQDAVIMIGDEINGLRVESSSNQFNNVFEGVDIEVTQVMTSGSTLVSVDITEDQNATKKSLNSIVDSYNTLMDNFDFLLRSGNEDESRGSLADFAAVKSMKRQISSLFRQSYDGQTLFSVGLEIDSQGRMSLNNDRFETTYNNDPSIFERMLKDDDALFDRLDEVVTSFTGPTGSVQTKLDYTKVQLDSIEDKLISLDGQYERQFQRYLTQFTNLNSVIEQMNTTSGLFRF